MTDPTELHEAYKHLDRKGIKTVCAQYMRMFGEDKDGKLIGNVSEGVSNTLYVAKKGAYIATPVALRPDLLEYVKAKGLLIAEIPFVGHSGHDDAIMQAYNLVKKQMGQVTLSDPVDISYADKDEIRKLKTRLGKSSSKAELEARAVELEQLISGYEDRQADTEREDLEDKFQSILDCLEDCQRALEDNDTEAAVLALEEALYQ